MDSSARLGEKADQIRKYERARAHRPNRRVLARASHKRWYEKHREEILAKNKNNPKKEARRLAAYAVKTGKIEKFPCEKCGSIKVHAHHDDYDNPLKVRWLCSKCHAEEHHGPRPIDPYAWKYGV